MVTVDAASATISFDTDKAKPAFFVPAALTESAQAHLSNGFDRRQPDLLANAWTATGQVKVKLDPSDTLKGWQFGFVQICRVLAMQIRYAGAASADGVVVLRPSKPPALTGTLLLDSVADARSPWTRFDSPQFPRFVLQAGSVVSAATGDHPSVRFSPIVTNDKTGQPNFLLDMRDAREFFTVFTAQDPGGKFQHLAHFHWTLVYDAGFRWTQSVVRATPMQVTSVFSFGSSIHFDSFANGPPTDADVLGLLSAPHGPQANDATKGAIRAAAVAVAGPIDIRQDFAEWGNVGDNFVPEGFVTLDV
jgi:hypothetical protein